MQSYRPREKMYEFADRLINLRSSRVRDFRGVNANAFDGRGNYALGIKEQLIFRKLNMTKLTRSEVWTSSRYNR